jgi:hypothetical protein
MWTCAHVYVYVYVCVYTCVMCHTVSLHTHTHTHSLTHMQAYFGTTFAHLFFLTFPELKVGKSTEKYVPRVFGFRVSKDAYSKSLQARKKQQKDDAERKSAKQGH